MILKEFVLVFRHFARRRLSSFIIILSIGIALSIATLLYTFIQRETLTDRFHSKSSLIYRLLSSDPFDDKGKTLAFIKKEATDYISTNYPEISRICRITELSANGIVLDRDSDSFEEVMVLAADTSFYDMFDYPFLHSTKTIGHTSSGIVITESLAKRIFGQTNVLGEGLSVHYDTLKLDFTVAGVLGTMTENSHLKFDAIVSFHEVDKYLRGSTTYIELDAHATKQNVESKISKDTQMPSLVGPGKCDYFLQSLPGIYFDKSNVRAFTTARNPDFLNALWLIMSFILLVGAFNFLNLFIISLVDRRKHFGVRKIQGATAGNIRSSVVFEIFVYVLMGLAVSIASSITFMPILNTIFQSDISIDYLFKPVVMGAVGILFVALVLVVSLVLTFYINRIQPINLLNDKSKVKIGFNKLFFTLQFIISLALIVSAVAIVKQVQFIKNKPLGFERAIIEVRLPKGGKPSDLYTLKTKLQQHALFKRLSLSNGNPVSGNQQIRFHINEREFYSSYFIAGDEDLIGTLDLQLTAGIVPSSSTGQDKVVNESYVRHFNIEDPVGAAIPGGKGARIIGVVSDFNVSSLKQEIPLYMIGYSEAPSRLLINFSGAPLDDVKDLMQGYWKEVFPDNPLAYSFLGEQLVSRHKDDLQFSRIIVTFSLVSIVMSCFGLFALAQSSCQKKEKEIAIRKTLGASTRGVVYMLLTDFGKWVVLSFTLASFLGYFVTRRWMETFAYRTAIDWPIFVITLAIGLCFFLVAIGSETIKAAKTNPIKGLRYE